MKNNLPLGALRTDFISPEQILRRTFHKIHAALAMKLGIASVSVIDEYMAFGYEGLAVFGQTLLDMISNRNFERNLAAHTRLPYSSWWLARDEHAFLEEKA